MFVDRIVSTSKQLKKSRNTLCRRTTSLMIGLLALVIGASGFRPQFTFAAVSYWDINGPVPGAGGPNAGGTWSLSAPNWTFDPAGTVPTSGWVPNDTALFSAGNDATGSFEVTVNGNQAVSGLLFEEGDVTLSGLAQLSFGGPAFITVAPSASGLISVAIAGNSGLVKDGAGTLILGGMQTYTGETIINAGTLRGAIPGSISINVNGTLGGTQTVNGNLTSAGHVSPGNSPGIITVNGNYMQMSSGVLDIEVAGVLPGTQHDQLVVTGTASLDGVLRIVSQVPNAPGTTVHVLDGNRAGTRFFNVETVAGSGIYFAPEYLPNGVNAVSFALGDMNRNGVLGPSDPGDVVFFAKALTDPDGYWNSSAISAVPQPGPACICIYGSSSGNMDGMSGLDFDDVDDFAAAAGVSAARVYEEIERLSAPEPNSTALVLMGILGAAVFASPALPTNAKLGFVTTRTTNLVVGMLAVVVSTTYFLPGSALAVDRYWDINGAVPGAGGPMLRRVERRRPKLVERPQRHRPNLAVDFQLSQHRQLRFFRPAMMQPAHLPVSPPMACGRVMSSFSRRQCHHRRRRQLLLVSQPSSKLRRRRLPLSMPRSAARPDSSRKALAH